LSPDQQGAADPFRNGAPATATASDTRRVAAPAGFEREVEMSRAELNGQVASGSPTMPSHVPAGLSVVDRFATRVSRFVSRAGFFMVCVLLVVMWAPSYFLLPDLDTWQLIINTVTTIVTFLLVALLQNTQNGPTRPSNTSSTPSPTRSPT